MEISKKKKKKLGGIELKACKIWTKLIPVNVCSYNNCLTDLFLIKMDYFFLKKFLTKQKYNWFYIKKYIFE